MSKLFKLNLFFTFFRQKREIQGPKDSKIDHSAEITEKESNHGLEEKESREGKDNELRVCQALGSIHQGETREKTKRI